jgi:hypothetical protein
MEAARRGDDGPLTGINRRRELIAVLIQIISAPVTVAVVASLSVLVLAGAVLYVRRYGGAR